MTIPQPFSWQQTLWQRLTQHTAQLAHGLLFSGCAGIGKFHLAQSLAATLLCDAPTANKIACGFCQSCQWWLSGTHPDYAVIQPDTVQGQIKIEAIRNLSQFVYHSAHRNGCKIALISPADALNQHAANALLKVLEEPPDGVYIMLVSSAVRYIPTTILSRCQHMACRMPSRVQARAWLETEAMPAENINQALDITHGAPLAASQLGHADGLQQYAECLQGFLALTQQQQDPVALGATWRNYNLQHILQWLYSWILDSLKIALHLPVQHLSHPDKIAELTQLNEKLKPNDLIDYLDKISRYLRQIAEQAQFNSQLALEDILITWDQKVTSH